MASDKRADSRHPIQHLILLCMENRSFDHFLGALAIEGNGRPDIDGLAQPPRSILGKDGQPVQNWCMDPPKPQKQTEPTFPDVPHDWQSVHEDWNNGANDGFVKTYQRVHPDKPEYADIPMGYYSRNSLKVLYSLADEFVVCDHWFASVLSSTWPNRKYLHSGKRDSDNDTQIIPGIAGFQTDPIYEFIAKQVDPDTKAPLTWRCYFTDVPFLAFWYRFAFRNVRNFEGIDAFLRDCIDETLPTISVIDPPFTLADDHPPHDPLLGEKFIGLVVDALTNSPSWKNSALVILYDEFGGFYDHVSPPAAPEPNPVDTPLGFRVPAIIVSPYAKKRYVSKIAYDHTSIIQSIAAQWKVPFEQTADEFGTRWKYAKPIWDDALDKIAPPRDCGTFTGDHIGDLNWGAGVRERLASPLGKFEAALERIFVLPELKALDRRSSAFDTLGKFEHGVITLKRSTGYAASIEASDTPAQ